MDWRDGLLAKVFEEPPTEFDNVSNVCPECHMVKPKNGECCE